MESKVRTASISRILITFYKMEYHSMFLDFLFLDLSSAENQILCEMFPEFKKKRVEINDMADGPDYIWGEHTRKQMIFIY